MKRERFVEIRGLADMAIEGSVAAEELKEAVEYIDTLHLRLHQTIAIAEQRGDRLEDEGESLGDPEEIQLRVARETLFG
jgi:hypothetical protein